jgi:hypothetical protein
VDGRDGASVLVDGRHESRQRVGRLALRSWSCNSERKERNKIYAAKKNKSKGESEARRGRLGPTHPRKMTHTPHPLSQIFPLSKACFLTSLLPFTLIAGCTTHRHTSPFFANCPANIDASPFQAHVCHFVITPITLTPTPQNTSLASLLHFPQRIAACTHPMSKRDYSRQPLSLHSGATRYYFSFNL